MASDAEHVKDLKEGAAHLNWLIEQAAKDKIQVRVKTIPAERIGSADFEMVELEIMKSLT